MIVDYKTLGQNIKHFRNKKNMRQAELAEILDVTPAHISHIECAHTKASLSTLLTIAQVLETDLYTLVGLEVPNAKQDAELMELLKEAAPEQRKQCLEICRTALAYSALGPRP